MVASAVPTSLPAGEVNSRLKQLVGTWYDTDLKKARCSAYEVSLNEDGDGFDVCTYRDSGRVIKSANLIRLDWQKEESACLTWGRRGGDHVFVAIEVNSSSIIWLRGTTEFRWQREETGSWAKEDAKLWMQEAKTYPYGHGDGCRGRGRRRVAQSWKEVSMSPPARSRSRGEAWEEDRALSTSRLQRTSWVTQLATSLLHRAKTNLEEELRGSNTSTRTSTASTATSSGYGKEPAPFYAALMDPPRAAPRPAADPFYDSLMETPRAKGASTMQARKPMRCTSVPVRERIFAPIPARNRKATRVSTSGKPARVSSSGKPGRLSSSGNPVSSKLSSAPRNALDAGGVIRVANFEDYSDSEYEYEYSDEEYSDCTADEDVVASAKHSRDNRKGWEWPMTNDEKKKAVKKHTKNIAVFDPQVLFDEISKLEENLRGKKMSVPELEDCTEKINGLQMMLEQHESGKARRVSCKF